MEPELTQTGTSYVAAWVWFGLRIQIISENAVNSICQTYILGSGGFGLGSVWTEMGMLYYTWFKLYRLHQSSNQFTGHLKRLLQQRFLCAMVHSQLLQGASNICR